MVAILFVLLWGGAGNRALSHPAISLSANLTGGQVVTSFGGEGSPAQSTNSASATLLYNPNALEGGLFLTYSLQFTGLDLDGLRTPNNPMDDVLGIQIRSGGQGTNGPHMLNVFGRVEGVVREDDANLSLDVTNSFLLGSWDDQDENLTGPGGTRRDVDSVKISSALDALFADGLYIHVATRAYPSGELRGQILNRPPLIVPLPLADGSLQFTIDHKSLREYRIESSGDLANWSTLTNLYALQNVIRFVDFEAAQMPRRYYRISQLVILPLHVVTQPPSQTVGVGQSLILNFEVGGSGPIAYQWLRDEIPISGGTNATLAIPSVLISDAGIYKAVASNPGGQAISDDVVVTVNP